MRLYAINGTIIAEEFFYHGSKGNGAVYHSELEDIPIVEITIEKDERSYLEYPFAVTRADRSAIEPTSYGIFRKFEDAEQAMRDHTRVKAKLLPPGTFQETDKDNEYYAYCIVNPTSGQWVLLNDHPEYVREILDPDRDRKLLSFGRLRYTSEGLDYYAKEQYQVLRVVLGHFIQNGVKNFTIRAEDEGEEKDIGMTDEIFQALGRLQKEGWLRQESDAVYTIAQGSSSHPDDPWNAPDLEMNRSTGKISSELPGLSFPGMAKYLKSTSKGRVSPGFIQKFEQELFKPHQNYQWGNSDDHQKNEIDPNALKRAVLFHQKVFNGKRWPALEYAFSQRAGSFEKSSGQMTRARMSLFTYLKNVGYRWPQGMQLAEAVIQQVIAHVVQSSSYADSTNHGYISVYNPDFIAYAERYHPKIVSHLAKGLSDKWIGQLQFDMEHTERYPDSADHRKRAIQAAEKLYATLINPKLLADFFGKRTGLGKFVLKYVTPDYIVKTLTKDDVRRAEQLTGRPFPWSSISGAIDTD